MIIGSRYNLLKHGEQAFQCRRPFRCGRPGFDVRTAVQDQRLRVEGGSKVDFGLHVPGDALAYLRYL